MALREGTNSFVFGGVTISEEAKKCQFFAGGPTNEFKGITGTVTRTCDFENQVVLRWSSLKFGKVVVFRFGSEVKHPLT